MPDAAEPLPSPRQVAALVAEGRCREALAAAAAIITNASLATLRSPKVRGPFPYPTDDDLARPAYLRELARWSEAAALRSRQSLGSRGVADTVAAARRLARVADLVAALQDPPGPEALRALAAAALRDIEAGASGMPQSAD